MTTAAPQSIEIASAKKFCDFRAREGSPAAIFHEIFEISNCAPDLNLYKYSSKNCSGTPRPNHNHQHTSLNKLTGGCRKRLSGFRARNQNVKKISQNVVHQFVASKPLRIQTYLDGGYLNRLYKSYAIKNDRGGAARHWNRVSEENLWI